MLPAPVGFGPSSGDALAFAALDCRVGNSCDRTFRIRVAAQDLKPGQTLAFAWSVDARLRYSGVQGTCGTPDGATALIAASDPISIAASAAAFAPQVEEQESGGALAARHITITSDGPAPIASSIRLSIHQPNDAPAETPWRPWIRVVADGSDVAAAEGSVGDQPYAYSGAPNGGTLDLPVLGNCPASGACTRGYWIIFQSYAVAPAFDSAGKETSPAGLGQLSWGVAATATYANPSATAPHLRLTVDNVAAALPTAVLEQAADPAKMSASPEPSSLEATFTLSERPGSEVGLDPLAASLVIVHVQAQLVSFGVHLEGDGAGSLSAVFNGDGSINLIAHPFDSCPTSGPCTVHVRIVGPFSTDVHFTPQDSQEIQWGVTVLGAPPGLTVSFAPRFDPAPSTGPSIEQVVALAWVLVLAVLGILIWRRRRAARTTE
jgi:hypothetical protein